MNISLSLTQGLKITKNSIMFSRKLTASMRVQWDQQQEWGTGCVRWKPWMVQQDV